MTPVILVVVIATSIWVAIDASTLGARHDRSLGMAGSSPAAWFFGCLLVWIVFFPLYLSQREKIRLAGEARQAQAGRPAGPSSAERTCPLCAETIKAAARRCRFCGADIEPLESGA